MEDAGHWIGKEPTAAGFEPATWFLKQLGDQLTAADLQRSRDHVQAAGRTLGAFFQRYDVLLTPTTAYPAIKLGETALKPAEKIGLGVLRTAPVKAVMMKLLRDLADQSLGRTPTTQLFNMPGLPAMSVPLHTAQNGVPVGMQFAAAYGGDGLLIRLAAQLEAARPWIGRKPGVCA